MLTCQELVELITDFVESVLEEQRHAEVLRHLSDCYVAQLQQTSPVLASMPTPTLSREDRAALIEACQDWCARQG